MPIRRPSTMERGSSGSLSFPWARRSSAELPSQIGSSTSARRECRNGRFRPRENAMKATIRALAALILLTATHAYAQSAQLGHSSRMAGSKDATVTLVYQHVIPGTLGKSVKGVLVEYGPGGYSPSH